MVYKVDGNLQLDSRNWSMYSNSLNSFKRTNKRVPSEILVIYARKWEEGSHQAFTGLDADKL